jgi:7-carboxy-7-deazaguanine synthase
MENRSFPNRVYFGIIQCFTVGDWRAMRIAELYQSVQGEGLLTGTASVFLRASGCNLRCGFCDTPYASWSPEGEDLSVAELLTQISSHEARHVVLTGGEPMLFAEMLPLCQRLREAGYHITIETAGTLYLPLDCNLMSISPKLSNSTPNGQASEQWRKRHEQSRHAPEVIERLIAEYEYQFKFVIGSREDCREVERYLQEFPQIAAENVWMMPLGIELEELSRIGSWLEEYCGGKGYRFCPRRHIEWFGVGRGT